MLKYEGIIIENPNLKRDLRCDSAFTFPLTSVREIDRVPEGVANGVPSEVYNGYRKGRDSACVDIVFVTRNEQGVPMVLFSKRSANVCYGGKWWIYGGALRSYCAITDFIAEKAEAECGVRAVPQALVGVYRTMSEDFIGSTLQPCYVAIVPIEKVREKKRVDDAHSNVKLFTKEELLELSRTSDEGYHWYPVRVALLALDNMPEQESE